MEIIKKISEIVKIYKTLYPSSYDYLIVDQLMGMDDEGIEERLAYYKNKIKENNDG